MYGIHRVITCLLLCASLTACMDIASTGAQAIYNKKNIEKTVGDQYITMQAYKTIRYKTKDFKDANVVIATYNRDVLLTGQVPLAWQKAEAEKIVKAIPDVKEVHNLITIQSPSSTLTKVSDTWITSKVKAKLLASDEVDASQIKVVTENGNVYLMGTLPAADAAEAAALASETEGVKSVIKIFSYITISKKPLETA